MQVTLCLLLFLDSQYVISLFCSTAECTNRSELICVKCNNRLSIDYNNSSFIGRYIRIPSISSFGAFISLPVFQNLVEKQKLTFKCLSAFNRNPSHVLKYNLACALPHFSFCQELSHSSNLCIQKIERSYWLVLCELAFNFSSVGVRTRKALLYSLAQTILLTE